MLESAGPEAADADFSAAVVTMGVRARQAERAHANEVLLIQGMVTFDELLTLWVSARTAQNNPAQRECHSLIVDYDVFSPGLVG
jgi:hypothetical protein